MGRPHPFLTLGGAIRSWTLLGQERRLLLHWNKELTAPGWPWAVGQASSPATAPLMPENGGSLPCTATERGAITEAEGEEGWLDPSQRPQHSAPTPSLPTSSRFAVLPGLSNRVPGAA